MRISKVNPFVLSAFFASFLLISAGWLPAAESQAAEQKKISKEDNKSTQAKNTKKKKEVQQVVLHNEIVVTATRTEKTEFNSPKPVAVVNQKKIEEKAPNNVSELLPEMPGTDIVGVGANQSRPVIRGLRGQRILLLSDGIRLSNSRRSQSFGEIPALSDVWSLERVEVVRGPASVLYGSEAIGGVLNLIPRLPDYNRAGTHFSGQIGYRFSSADNQHKAFAGIGGNINNFGFMLSGSYRNARNYEAPSGTFGNIKLIQTTPVLDSGLKDNNINFFMGLRISENNNISLRFENYSAKNAGFGYVNPAVYSPGDPTIRLLYPDQKVQKLTLRYENRALRFALADGMNVTGYFLKNNRTFDTHITIPFFPGAGMKINSSNFTDIKTYGTRLELTKVLFRKHVLTYGLDFYQDNSRNTDSNTTEYFGFGYPMIFSDNISKIPNAFFHSFGFFLQDDITLFSRASMILGVRYQNVHAQSRETAGMTDPLVSSTDSTAVGAANFLFSLSDNLKVVLSLGRGFRSANLPERFYQGVTPDGGAYQIRNIDLKPETSFNMDFGLRYRLRNLYLEATIFRNQISNGIQIEPTGLQSGRLPEYMNINVESLRIQGLELLGEIRLGFGLTLTANYSRLKSKNLTNPELMFADTYGSRLNLDAYYTLPGDLVFVEYHIRHNGNRKDVQLGVNPIGSIIPGFTVHTLRAGITLFKQSAFPQQIGIAVENLTDTLYAEFSNASFFRPAPRRHIVFTWITRF